jgi:hypothetical protein
MHDPGSGQADVSEPTMVGLPDLQRQVETGEAMPGEGVSDESSGRDILSAGEAGCESGLMANHAYSGWAETVGAAQAGQSSVPKCESRRERERERAIASFRIEKSESM